MLMILIGYILAMFMGLTLGLIGTGGSILTVPILVYFFKIQPITATGYSLLVVGLTALIGCSSFYRRKEVFIKEAIIFAIPAMLATIFFRAYVIPNLPSEIIGLPKSKDK